MTREEAIAVLKGYTGNPLVNDTKAFEMAIKAMEQEPKTDILDKIRAEIEKWRKEGTNWSDIRLMKIEDILDKYKAESEG